MKDITAQTSPAMFLPKEGPARLVKVKILPGHAVYDEDWNRYTDAAYVVVQDE